MAHAGMTEAVGGEVGQPPRRHQLLASIEHSLGMLVEIPAALLVVAEIELRLELRAHLDDGGERKSLFAAKSLQRSDGAFG